MSKSIVYIPMPGEPGALAELRVDELATQLAAQGVLLVDLLHLPADQPAVELCSCDESLALRRALAAEQRAKLAAAQSPADVRRRAVVQAWGGGDGLD